MGTVECLRLSQKDVARVLSAERCAVSLESVTGAYKNVQTLKASEVVAKPLRKFWELMVHESAQIAGGAELSAGEVTREGYTQMHLRISKSLQPGFSLAQASDVANADWAEDITAFSGDSGARTALFLCVCVCRSVSVVHSARSLCLSVPLSVSVLYANVVWRRHDNLAGRS